MVTIGLFIFAWTIYPDVHWIGAIIGSAVFGAGYAYHITLPYPSLSYPPSYVEQNNPRLEAGHARKLWQL